MKHYLAIYTGSPSSPNSLKWETLSEAAKQEKIKAGMTGWMNWGVKNQKSIIAQGGPLGKTIKVSNSGMSPITNQMAAYTIVQAESHEEAAKLFLDHPHFAIFPGDGVEIMECMPIPEM